MTIRLLIYLLNDRAAGSNDNADPKVRGLEKAKPRPLLTRLSAMNRNLECADMSHDHSDIFVHALLIETRRRQMHDVVSPIDGLSLAYIHTRGPLIEDRSSEPISYQIGSMDTRSI